MKEAPDKFLILPLGELKASDEALFATTAFLEKNQAAVAVLVEELLQATRAINANPAFAVEERKRLGLLKDLPEKMEAEVLPYYQEGVQGGIFPADGGAARAAANDLEFFALAGQIKGDGVKAEDFWTFGPAQGGAGAARLLIPDVTGWTARRAGLARRVVPPVLRCLGGRGAVAGEPRPSRPSAGPAVAFVRMTLDGSFARAYASTLQPLVIGVAISAALGVGAGRGHGPEPLGGMADARRCSSSRRRRRWPRIIPMITFVYGIGLTAKVLAVTRPGRARDRHELLQGDPQHVAVAARDVPLVPGDAGAGGLEDRPAARRRAHLRRAAPRRGDGVHRRRDRRAPDHARPASAT